MSEQLINHKIPSKTPVWFFSISESGITLHLFYLIIFTIFNNELFYYIHTIIQWDQKIISQTYYMGNKMI